MTREELKQKINTILSDSDSNDRKVANILIEHTLPQMQNYYEKKIEELKRQLLDEKIQDINKYEIAITICEREKVSLLDDVLFPVYADDITDMEYFITKDSICFPVFLASDEQKTAQYEAEGIRGMVHTQVGDYAAEFKLVRNSTYLDILQQCREAFAGNGVFWNEVNDAYLHKFFYLETDMNIIQGDAQIAGYSVENQELNQKLYKKIIPLWNVRHITIAANDFPVMQENSIKYCYDFQIPDNIEMLIDNENKECEDGCLVKYKDRVSFFSNDNSRQSFSVWQIYAADFPKINSEYIILTNGVKREMWSSMEHSKIVHSAFELERCINTLSISEKITYEGYKVLQDHDSVSDCVVARKQSNALPVQGRRSYLELILHNAGLPQYLYRDTIQYIVNTVQSEFREYIVICNIGEGK